MGNIKDDVDASSAANENVGTVATVDATKEGVQLTRHEKRKSILVGLTDSPEILPSMRESICLDFYFDDESLFDAIGEEAVDAAPAVAQAHTDSEETTLAMRRESIYSDAIGVPPLMITIL